MKPDRPVAILDITGLSDTNPEKWSVFSCQIHGILVRMSKCCKYSVNRPDLAKENLK